MPDGLDGFEEEIVAVEEGWQRQPSKDLEGEGTSLGYGSVRMWNAAKGEWREGCRGRNQ